MKQDNFWEFWLNSTTEFVFLKDLEGKYIDASLSIVKASGNEKREDIIGKTDYDIYSKENADAFVAQDREVVEKKSTVVDSDWWYVKELDKKILIETIKSPLYDANGEIVGIQGISRDITEKHTLEQQLNEQKLKMQAILDSIPAPIWIKDRNNCYILVNSTYEEFYNVKKEDLLGQGVTKILRAKSLFSAQETKLLNMQDLEVINKKVVKRISLWTDEKNKRLIEITKSPILTPFGDCIGLTGVSYDVTSRIAKPINNNDNFQIF